MKHKEPMENKHKKKEKRSKEKELSNWKELISFCSNSPSDYEEFEEILKYTFQNPSPLYEALTHKSALLAFGKSKKVANFEKLGLGHYERVEFLGDSVLGLTISSILWTQENPKTKKLYTEGELSRIKAYLVSEATLAKIARELSLEKLILLSKAEKINNGSQRESLLADCLEALIGAVFSESGYNQAQRLIKRLYKKILTQDLLELSLDYKSQLQEIIQGKEKKSPHYETLETSGPDHEKKFKVGVYFAENRIASAWGASKKKASQQAAKEALENLKQNKTGYPIL